jgi:hypothetical protein
MVAGSAGQIVAQRLEPPRRVVGIVGRGGPAAPRAAAGPVVGEAGDRIPTILPDQGDAVEAVGIVGEEAPVGMGDPDAVAICVIAVADRPGDAEIFRFTGNCILSPFSRRRCYIRRSARRRLRGTASDDRALAPRPWA